MPSKPSLKESSPAMEDTIFLLKALVRDMATVSDRTETADEHLKRLLVLLDLLEPEGEGSLKPAVKLRAILLSLVKQIQQLTSAMMNAGNNLMKLLSDMSLVRQEVAAQAMEITKLQEVVESMNVTSRETAAQTRAMRGELQGVLSLLPAEEG